MPLAPLGATRRHSVQCNATVSLKQFFDMVYEEPKKMLLYGDACRVSTDPIAKASYFFDLIQVSCWRERHLWSARSAAPPAAAPRS